MFLKKKALIIQLILIGLLVSSTLCIENKDTHVDDITQGLENGYTNENGFVVDLPDHETFVPEEIDDEVHLTDEDMLALQDELLEEDKSDEKSEKELEDKHKKSEKKLEEKDRKSEKKQEHKDERSERKLEDKDEKSEKKKEEKNKKSEKKLEDKDKKSEKKLKEKNEKKSEKKKEEKDKKSEKKKEEKP